MASHVVVGHLKAIDLAARQKIIDQFEVIVGYSRSDEPGVHRYAITVPIDTADETSIYAIEEYADQKVSDGHLAASAVQDLISLLGSQPPVLAGAPQVYQFEYTGNDHHFTRPGLKDLQDPLIVFATSKQKSAILKSELQNTWQEIVRQAQSDESDTLMYALLRDKENENQLGTVEAYTDQGAFEKHCQSKQVAELVEKNKATGGEMAFVSLKLVSGWLLR